MLTNWNWLITVSTCGITHIWICCPTSTRDWVDKVWCTSLPSPIRHEHHSMVHTGVFCSYIYHPYQLIHHPYQLIHHYITHTNWYITTSPIPTDASPIPTDASLLSPIPTYKTWTPRQSTPSSPSTNNNVQTSLLHLLHSWAWVGGGSWACWSDTSLLAPIACDSLRGQSWVG